MTSWRAGLVWVREAWRALWTTSARAFWICRASPRAVGSCSAATTCTGAFFGGEAGPFPRGADGVVDDQAQIQGGHPGRDGFGEIHHVGDDLAEAVGLLGDEGGFGLHPGVGGFGC